jgi:hypothetical protein
MTEAMHPADPIYLGLQISQLRFEIEHRRPPTNDESLALVRERLDCDDETAEGVLASVGRTLELEKMAHDLLDRVMPDIMGGAFAGFARRR